MNQSGEGTNFVKSDIWENALINHSFILSNMSYLCIIAIYKYFSCSVANPRSDWRCNESIKKVVGSSLSVKFVTVSSLYKLFDTLACY